MPYRFDANSQRFGSPLKAWRAIVFLLGALLLASTSSAATSNQAPHVKARLGTGSEFDRLEGEWGSAGYSPADACMRVAFRLVGHAGWRLSDRCLPLAVQGLKWKWSWPLAELEGRYPSGSELCLRAVAFPSEPRFSAEWLTDSELDQAAIASSEEDVLYTMPGPAEQVALTPRIRITAIGKIAVPKRQHVPLDVGLNEQISGEYEGPPLLYRHIIVQPLVGGTRWVMHSEPPGRQWKAHAQFGRYGLDEFEQFALVAVVSSRPLRPGRILPEEWYQLLRTSIRALSKPVFVVRTDTLYDPERDVGVEIVEVGPRRPARHQATPVALGESIRGHVKGRKLTPKESLVLFTRTDESDWVPAGRPHLARDGSWEIALPSEVAVGVPITVLAAISNQLGQSYDRASIVSESAPVRVVVRAAPVEIVAVNGQPARAESTRESPLVTSAPLTVELSTPARSRSFVQVFYATETQPERWHSLGPAIATSAHTALTFPSSPKCRGRLLLVAVQTSVPTDELDVALSTGQFTSVSAASVVEVLGGAEGGFR